MNQNQREVTFSENVQFNLYEFIIYSLVCVCKHVGQETVEDVLECVGDVAVLHQPARCSAAWVELMAPVLATLSVLIFWHVFQGHPMAGPYSLML